MPRTTDSWVRGVIKVRTGFDLTPLIAVANRLVTNVIGDTVYDAETTADIETYLAAHLYDVYAPRASATGVATANVQYEPIRSDLYLNETKYGSTALALDYKCKLAAVNNLLKVIKAGKSRTRWLGTPLE